MSQKIILDRMIIILGESARFFDRTHPILLNFATAISLDSNRFFYEETEGNPTILTIFLIFLVTGLFGILLLI